MMNNVKLNEFLLAIFLSLAFSLNFFIFNQIEIILTHQIIFGFNADEVFWAFLIEAVSFFVIIFTTLFLLAQFNKAVFKIVAALLLGFVLASYVQVLFLNGNYVSGVNPQDVLQQPWGAGMQVLSLLVWLAVFLLPLGVAKINRMSKLNWFFKKEIFTKFVAFSSVIVFSMQTFGLVITSHGATKRTIADEVFYFSLSQQLTLSTEHDSKNIVVFLLDRWPVWRTDQTFETFPHAKEIFDGFTYFRNTLSSHAQTFPSAPKLLTGYNFPIIITGSQTLDRAWEQATLFDELADAGFKRNLLLNFLTYYSLDNISPHVDNIIFPPDATRQVRSRYVVSALRNFAWQRILPYTIKNIIDLGFPTNITRVVTSDAADRTDFFPVRNFGQGDIKFITRLLETGLSESTGNTFSFVHMHAPHSSPYGIYAGGQRKDLPPYTYAIYTLFSMLSSYFNEMRRLGVFDSSTIIVMTDHGDVYENPIQIIDDWPHWRNCWARYSSSLFIKPAMAPQTPLVVDHTTPMSLNNFLPTMMEIIGVERQINDRHYGYSWFDIIRGARPSRDVFVTYTPVGDGRRRYNAHRVPDDWLPNSFWPWLLN